MMRALFLITSMCVAPLVHAGDKPPLGFYVVSKEARPGLHFFESATLPKLGYIAEKPDLPISQLEAVSVDTYRDRSQLIHKDGSVERAKEDRPALNIRLTTSDAKSLEALTSAHLGSRILLMVGDEALFAPVIRAPIITQELQISLPPSAGAEKLKARLQTFVRP
jgi:preprotein translocase subunit SecD